MARRFSSGFKKRVRAKHVYAEWPYPRKVRFEWEYYSLEETTASTVTKGKKHSRKKRLIRILSCGMCGTWYRAEQPTIACSRACTGPARRLFPPMRLR